MPSISAAVRINLWYICRYILPILVIIIAVPQLLSPQTLEAYKKTFDLIIVSKSVCSMPDCKDFFDPILSANPNLVQYHFEHFESIYIRTTALKRIDDFFITCLKSRIFARVCGLFKLNVNDQLIETVVVALALIYSTCIGTVRGMIISKLHGFLLWMGVLSFLLMWSPLIKTFYRSITEANYTL